MFAIRGGHARRDKGVCFLLRPPNLKTNHNANLAAGLNIDNGANTKGYVNPSLQPIDRSIDTIPLAVSKTPLALGNGEKISWKPQQDFPFQIPKL